MNLKKSVFSYIIWAAFVPLCCLGIVFCLQSAGISDMTGWPLPGIVGAVCVYLVFTAAVFIALRTVCVEIERHIRDINKWRAVFGVMLPALILAGIVAYLAFFLVYHTPLTLEDDSYYRLALVSDGKSVPFSMHGASWLYTCLLRVMLLIFGNTPFAGIVLQIVLFFICLLFLYTGMRAFAGAFSAVFSMAAFAFVPVSLRYVFSLTPELFYLALYLFGFSLTGALYRLVREREALHQARYILFFLSGLYIGFLCYLDPYGISLYLLFGVLFSLGRKKVRQALFAGLSTLLGGMGGFLLSVLALSLSGKMAFGEYLSEFIPFYLRGAGFEAPFFQQGFLLPDVSMVGSLIVISTAFFVVPSFFLWKRNQCSAFIVNLFLAYGLSMASFFKLDGQMVITLGWAMLAGLGSYGVVRLPEEVPEERKTVRDGEDDEDESTEKKETCADKSGIRKQADVVKRSDTEKKADVPREPESRKNTDTADKSEAEKEGQLSEKNVSAGMSGKKREQAAPPPGAPLHNPLPVPKKKKRHAADFGYQVREEDMKFDLEIKDDDDFDW